MTEREKVRETIKDILCSLSNLYGYICAAEEEESKQQKKDLPPNQISKSNCNNILNILPNKYSTNNEN